MVNCNHLCTTTIFRRSVELAEAVTALKPSEWSALPVDIEGPSSPHFERWMERHRRLRRIEEETQRLKQSLGATGPLEFRDGKVDGGPEWENYERQFNNTDHDKVVRLAFLKLATAAIDLSGFATWRELQWYMWKTGLRLLVWGLAQLWEGMSGEEKSRVRDYLQRTHKAISWPDDPTNEPRPYNGPEEIPSPDKCRIISNYISCYRDYLDDVQKDNIMRVEQGAAKFLRRATLARFVERAEHAAQALRAMMERDIDDFDTAAEWRGLYIKAFWSLACLRRAGEIQPREAWPPNALKQRKLLADAAGILLACVGGTPEAKASYKPEDEDKAFGDFTRAILRLRALADPTGQAPERSTECGEGHHKHADGGCSNLNALKLKPAAKKAYYAFQYAETKLGKKLEDQEAYDYLIENGVEQAPGQLGDLADYELPKSLESFRRYLGEARKALGDQKYNRRGRWPIGRSILRRRET